MGQKSWYWQNPFPQGNTLLRVAAGSSDLWAVGGPGVVLFSTDGGAVWEAQDPNTAVTLRAVDFVDDLHGVVVGDAGTIRVTASAGTSWTVVNSGVASTRALRGVSMATTQTGWVVGDVGITRKTSDGGSTWTTQTNTAVQLNDVCAVDGAHAWTVGAVAGGFSTVRATTDGGSTWTTQSVPSTVALSAVSFVDTQTGYAVGATVSGMGTIIKTTNGGSTWTTVSAGATSNLTDVKFVSPTTGWIAESNGSNVGAIRYTTDGGATWTLQMSGLRGINGLAPVDAANVSAVGVTGVMMRTADAGLSWVSQSRGTTRVLYGASFVDSDTGYAVGATGLVMCTDDGGDTWTSATSGSGNWTCVSFADAQTGWIAGVAGSIRKTTDGGDTWALQSSNTTQQINSIAAVTTQTAYAAGNLGVILKTTDGGATWVPQASGVVTNIQDVYFLDSNTGWAACNSGRLRKTVNGGSTWTTATVAATVGVSNTLYSVHFTDANNGWVVGTSGIIRKTSNGGSTWTAQTSGTSSALYSVAFSDANNGWAVGGVAGSPAVVVHTVNGGATWTAQNANMVGILRAVSTVDAARALAVGDTGSIRQTTDGGSLWVPQTYGTLNQLLAVTFVDAYKGWTAGASGTIMHTLDGGVTWAALVSGTTNALRGIEMRPSGLGWVVGDAGTIRSTVDGRNWTAQTSGTSVALQAVDFVDDTRGWAVGASANVRATIDGGSTWTTQTTSVSTATPLYGVSFVDTQTGWAWGGAAGVKGLMLHTTNGGSTWSTQTVGVASGVVLRAGAFVDTQTGWVAGTSGVIKKTVDGGSTWTTETVGTTGAIYAMKFITPTLGFHVGGAGGTTPSFVRRTTDGGSTWTTQTPGTFNVPYGLSFSDTNNGWLVGDGGMVLRTTDSIPPNTTMTVSPSVPDGTNGWYVTAPTVSLAVDEPAITYYSWTASTGPWATYSLPLERAVAGTSTLRYFSVDPGGNVEALHNGSVRFDVTPPATVGTPTVTPVATSTVTVSWPGSVDAVSGLSYYRVFVNGSVAATSAVTTATVSGLATETAYGITVSAVDVAGNASAPSPAAGTITLAERARPPLAVYARSAGESGTFVDWGEATGTVAPVSYRVWRSTGGGPFSALATVSAGVPRTFDDTRAPYFSQLVYAVSVVDARGEGPMSAATALASTLSTAQPAPAVVTVKNTASVLVTWTPVELLSPARYNVYRATTSTATPALMTPAPISASSYHDTSVAAFTEYWYRIATVDASDNVGVIGRPVFIRTEATTSSAAPHGAYAEDSSFCALCHSAHTSSSTATLAQEPGASAAPTRFGLLQGSVSIDAQLCFSCHDGTSASDIRRYYEDPSRTSRHTVGANDGDLVCSNCHDVHSAEQTGSVKGLLRSNGVVSGNKYCYTCHGATAGATVGGDLRGFEGSAHATAVVDSTAGSKVVCLGCHVGHSSREARLFPYSGDDRCLGCHSNSTSSASGVDIDQRLSGDGADTRHDLRAADSSSTGSLLTCENCHEPHVSSATTPCVDPDNPSNISGIPTTGTAGVTFCLKCHDSGLPTSVDTSGWAPAPLAAGGATSTANIAAVWSTNFHGGGTSTNPRLLPTMGYAAGDSLTCEACHDPHGSPNRFMLLDTVRAKSGTMTADALLVVPVAGGGADLRFFCSSCHDVSASTHPGPAQGGADLSVYPLDCTASACHRHVGNGL